MLKRFLYRVFCGFFLGISVFAPGFSGSIVAIVLGIYEDLLRIISNPFKPFKKNVLFCFPLGIGVVVSGVLFVIVFRYLFDTYEKATYLLFIGLIAGNLPIIFAKVKESGFKKHYLFGAVCAFAAALALGVLTIGVGQSTRAEGLTAGLPLLALSGFAGGVTTLIPGMSVSMVLIIFGVYNQLLFAANTFLSLDMTFLVPFGLFTVCAVIGLVLTSRGIKYIWVKYPGLASATIFGFMLGSLIGIFVQSLRITDESFTWLSGGVMLAIGLGVSMLFVVLKKKMNVAD